MSEINYSLKKSVNFLATPTQHNNYDFALDEDPVNIPLPASVATSVAVSSANLSTSRQQTANAGAPQQKVLKREIACFVSLLVDRIISVSQLEFVYPLINY